MLKVAFFPGEDERGLHVVPLLNSLTDKVFEKTAAPSLLPDVVRYIESLRPRPDAQYVLVNALGAGEFWGSNINGDYFPEAALIHAPDSWTGNPLTDAIASKDWPYGYPTFYNAQPFAHHRNKDMSRGFGAVELSVWNDKMKRVELVCRVDKDKCEKFGEVSVWDKLKAGQYPDVSMGCKVPFDTCSICLDWKKYREAQATFDKSRHKHQGDAVLELHKKANIRGVSITRKDYCEHARTMMNRILPDGRKVFVYNDYPKFFDISFVFVGADRTAKVMMKIAGDGQRIWSFPSAKLAEELGYDEESKTASVDELKLAFLGKSAKDKQSEIIKDIVPSQFASKAVPVLTKNEPDLPKDILDLLGGAPLEKSLSTSAGMGVVLRPKEFQRVILIQMGKRDLADDYDRKGIIFPKSEDSLDVPMDSKSFSPSLAKLLLPFLGLRSALGPSIEKRVLIVAGGPAEKKASTSSLPTELLRKISSAYNGYRNGVMELVANAPDLMSSKTMSSLDNECAKLASISVEEFFTPLSICYIKQAFFDEVHNDDVERGVPSRNTAPQRKVSGGFS